MGTDKIRWGLNYWQDLSHNGLWQGLSRACDPKIACTVVSGRKSFLCKSEKYAWI